VGLFDIFKKKERAREAAPAQPLDDDAPAPGWEALTRAFEGLYPGQTEPVHRAPLIHRMHDLSENAAAFDGISAYDAGDHWHFVSYGLSELYGKESEDAEVSGFGYELTFKLPRQAEQPPAWAFDFLEAIGKSVWKGAAFAAGHTIKTGPLDGRPETPQNAVLVVRDPALPEALATAHGQVELLLLVGVEDEMRQRVLAAHKGSDAEPGWERAIVSALRASNPMLVTPIARQGEWGAK
jgi:suppressor of fused-like protein